MGPACGIDAKASTTCTKFSTVGWAVKQQHTVDGNQKSGVHQLRETVVYPIIYKVL